MQIIDNYIVFDADFYPFWEYIGLEECCTPSDVRKMFDGYAEAFKVNPYIRFAFKLLIDPFFSEVYRKYRSIKQVYNAGFFIDGYDHLINLDKELNFTTPIRKIIDNIENSSYSDNPFIVLLETGGFSPIHKKHLENMEITKVEFESRGYRVVGGYLSPAHDNYVSSKYNGLAEMHIEIRNMLIEKCVSGSDWLYLDRWEGTYNSMAVNYTDVIQRLERYLNHYIPTSNGIRVCFVCGKDNSGFLQTFEDGRGYVSFIGLKKDAEKTEKLLLQYRGVRSIAVLLQESDVVFSSDFIRKGNNTMLPDPIKEDYSAITNGRYVTTQLDTYSIRNDIFQDECFTVKMPEGRVNDFVAKFSWLIEEIFDHRITINMIDVNAQLCRAQRILSEKHLPSVSLDVYVKGEYNLEVSRLFDMSSGQVQSICLINRPESAEISKQISAIPAGEYILVEDDIGSGSTLRYLESLLPEKVTIADKLILSQLSGSNVRKAHYDIVDLRDFVLGAKHGGLVVKLPSGEMVRVPYILPYVSNIFRSKTPPGKELGFSLDLWKMNRGLYLDTGARVGDFDAQFQRFMKFIGFTSSHLIMDVIEHHIKLLQRAVGI